MRVIEAVALPDATGTGVLLGDAVREAGLDPELYIAVIPAEMGRAGRVNRNGRVYIPEELVAEHTRLCTEAAKSFIDGELGHPEAGPTFNVPVRLLDGECVTESDGSVLARGRFAITNTQAGRDVLTLWRAGLGIGTSLRAMVRFTEHVIDGKSRYAKANPDFVGVKVIECSRLRLENYDVVRVPSAGTHFTPAEGPVAEAYQRVIESQSLPEQGSTPAEPANEQENQMNIKTIAELLAAFPELMAEHAKQVTEAADPFAKLDATQKAAVKVALEAVKAKPESATDESALVKAVREQADVDRARLVDLERAQKVAEAARQESDARLAAVTEKLARAENRAAVSEALGDTWAKGRKNAAGIRRLVLEDFDAGRVKDAAGALAEAERLEKLVAESVALAGAVTTPPAPPATPPTETVTEARDSTLTPEVKAEDPFNTLINGL